MRKIKSFCLVALVFAAVGSTPGLAQTTGCFLQNVPAFSPDDVVSVDVTYFRDANFPNPDYNPFSLCNPGPATLDMTIAAMAISTETDSFTMYCADSPTPIDPTLDPIGLPGEYTSGPVFDYYTSLGQYSGGDWPWTDLLTNYEWLYYGVGELEPEFSPLLWD